MANQSQRKVGRPSLNKEYRKNIVRVSAVEDWLQSIIDKIPDRSKAKGILVEELQQFVNKENEKAANRVVD